MNEVWIFTLGSVFIISLIAFVGLLTVAFGKQRLHSLLLVLISFSAGALLGDTFIHILPEAIEQFGWSLEMSIWLLLGIIIFFALEKFVHWHHHHHVSVECDEEETHTKPYVVTTLVGDGLHNFIDGFIIAGTYLVSVPLGIATTIAVALHEVPQEIGDFGILLHGGLSRRRALLFNFLSALCAVLGALIVLVLGVMDDSFLRVLLPLTAGSFIYVAATDLIPEMHKEVAPAKSLLQLFGFLVGIALMIGLTFIEAE